MTQLARRSAICCWERARETVTVNSGKKRVRPREREGGLEEQLARPRGIDELGEERVERAKVAGREYRRE